MLRAAWEFWREEETMVEDKGGYRREVGKVLNSEERGDFLICYKLALLTTVLLRSLLTFSKLRLAGLKVKPRTLAVCLPTSAHPEQHLWRM